jgi:hypothetical protein
MLYEVIESHQAASFVQLGERGGNLPGFVREEFEAYLRCGQIEHGFVPVKRNPCRHEHRVALSCKCRGSRPSCAARRTVETAARWSTW